VIANDDRRQSGAAFKHEGFVYRDRLIAHDCFSESVDNKKRQSQ